MTYAPQYKTKKAPDANGFIAWEDGTRKPFYIKYNGKAWEARPVDGEGRVETGFSFGGPIAEFDSVESAHYHVASGGVHAYTPEAEIPLTEQGESVVEASARILPAAKKAIKAIAQAEARGTPCTYGFTTKDVGQPSEILTFSASRRAGNATVTVHQEHVLAGPKRTKGRPMVSIVEHTDDGDVVVLKDHTLAGEKHLPWFFQQEEDEILTWVEKAKQGLRRKQAHEKKESATPVV